MHLAHTSAESTERRRVTEERLQAVVALMIRDDPSRHSQELAVNASKHSLYREITTIIGYRSGRTLVLASASLQLFDFISHDPFLAE